MPVQLSCPSCQRPLRVPDNLIGKTVKCPGCQTAFQAVVEEEPPPAPKKASYREDEPPARAEREERYQEEAPVRRSSRRRDDDADDDYDDRPRRRRRGSGDYVPHRGTLILVLGILGLVGCGIFTAIPAWIMGANDLKEIRAGRMDPEGEQLTNIGKILGMISCILTLVILSIYCVIFIIAMAGAAAGK
ncbi:MAG: hypothetical protein ACJ8F7_15440 [Gemmataceae bacterium]